MSNMLKGMHTVWFSFIEGTINYYVSVIDDFYNHNIA